LTAQGVDPFTGEIHQGEKLISTPFAAAKKLMEESYARTNWKPGEVRSVWPSEIESVTAEAERITTQERNHSYGPPHEDFAKVTGMALALWGRGPQTPKEHAMYMVLVKLAREAHEHKRDNLVDIAGYASTIQQIVEWEERDGEEGSVQRQVGNGDR
jgi:hypothetical protein